MQIVHEINLDQWLNKFSKDQRDSFLDYCDERGEKIKFVSSPEPKRPYVAYGLITHRVKCWPKYFEPFVDGKKTYELRKNDRDYQVGHLFVNNEWDPETGRYTGRTSGKYEITHILGSEDFPDAIGDGYVALSLVPVGD